MINKIVEILNKNYDENIDNISIINKNEIYIEIDSVHTENILSYIYFNMECSLISLFANDERTIHDRFSIYYVFSIKKVNILLIIKANLEKDILKVKSITREIPVANLYEREIKDMYGITFEDHPDSRELVFHENWPSLINPLKKDYDASKKTVFVHKPQKFTTIVGEGVFEIPVGPVHAGIIEPGHFRFSVAGEPIINLEAKLYYVHKGIEKLSENQDFEKVVFISERISGDETITNSIAFCQAIEKISLVNENIPERAIYTRTILSELERLYNHIGDIAGICLDVAYEFAAYQFNMMRRWCLILNEEITGNRFLRSTIKPGGIRKDFLRDKENLVISVMNKLYKEFEETVSIIKSNTLFSDRIENTGIVHNKIAIDLNAVGPAGRCAGINGDVRVDFPYDAYKKINVNVSIHNIGDVNCRLNVKIHEVYEAIRIIKIAFEGMPMSSKIIEPILELEPYEHAFGLTESPRGENCHFVMSGENNTIYRYKIRTPSFNNWPVLCHAVKGNIIADFPLINKSFNLSYAGNDL